MIPILPRFDENSFWGSRVPLLNPHLKKFPEIMTIWVSKFIKFNGEYENLHQKNQNIMGFKKIQNLTEKVLKNYVNKLEILLFWALIENLDSMKNLINFDTHIDRICEKCFSGFSRVPLLNPYMTKIWNIGNMGVKI